MGLWNVGVLVGELWQIPPCVIQLHATPAHGLQGKSSARGDFLLLFELFPVPETQIGLADLSFCKLLTETPFSQTPGRTSLHSTMIGREFLAHLVPEMITNNNGYQPHSISH